MAMECLRLGAWPVESDLPSRHGGCGTDHAVRPAGADDAYASSAPGSGGGSCPVGCDDGDRAGETGRKPVAITHASGWGATARIAREQQDGRWRTWCATWASASIRCPAASARSGRDTPPFGAGGPARASWRVLLRLPPPSPLGGVYGLSKVTCVGEGVLPPACAPGPAAVLTCCPPWSSA